MAMRINTNIAALNALRHLNKTEKEMSSTLERLASGRRINSAADGPAALVISEQMKAQISSIGQAISNSETSVSMVQTAEGALNEVSNILINLRQLAVHAANEGTNDIKMLQADQSEISNLISTLERIADTTQFGTRPLLDGSNSVKGVAVGDGLEFVSAGENTRPSPAEGYKVNITQVPTRAMIVGTRPVELEEAMGSFVITSGNNSVALNVENNKTLKESIQKIIDATKRETSPLDEYEAKSKIQYLISTELQKRLDEAGMDLEVIVYKPVDYFGYVLSDWDEEVDAATQIQNYPPELKEMAFDEVLVVRHKEYGSEPSFTITTSLEGLFGSLDAPANEAIVSIPGRDIEGTIGGHPEFGAGQVALGRGQYLSAAPGTDAEGLTILYNKNTDDVIYEIFNREDFEFQGVFLEEKSNEFLVGNEKPGIGLFSDVIPEIDGYVHLSQNSLAFQVGPNQGQQVRLSIENVRPSSLADGIKNESGFESLIDINVTDSMGAQDSILLIDEAIEEVSTLRAKLGAFQKNALESNLNSLRIAKENLTSAESELSDADMAAEMSDFVKNQILLSSGTAMLAQANQTPRSVLQLLNTGA